MFHLYHAVALTALLFLLSASAHADSQERPDSTDSSSNNTCDGTPTAHETMDDDPDAPDSVFCVSNTNNVNSDVRLTFPTPSFTLDTTTDAQVFAIFLEEFDTGQSGTAQFQLDVYDGVGCADLHETGATQTVPDKPGALMTEAWTAAGISAIADVCVRIICVKSGGSPSKRQACDWDAIEWRAKEAVAGGGRTRRMF